MTSRQEANPDRSNSIVVTGASGFIGRRLVERLCAEGNRVVSVVRAADEAPQQFGAKAVTLVPADLVSGEGLGRLPRSPRLVFHLAAVTDTGAADHRVSDVGSANLLNALEPLDRRSHLVFTSSILVNDHRSDYTRPVDESTPDPERPENEYGRRKLRAERLLVRAARRQGFRLSILRVGVVYGAGVRPGGFVHLAVDLAKKGAFVSRLNWPGRISFIALDDVVDVLIGITERPPQPGDSESYVLATETLTLADVSRLVAARRGLRYRPIALPPLAWRLGAAALRRGRPLEPLLPRRVYNRLWQASLLVEHVCWNQSQRVPSRFPDLKPRLFQDWLRQLPG